MSSKQWSLDNFKSPLHVIARKLFLSRNQLRIKYRSVKTENKRLKVQVHDVKKSKEKYKKAASESQAKVAQLEAEVQQLRAAQADCDEKKTTVLVN